MTRCLCSAVYHQGKPCVNDVTVWLDEEASTKLVCTPCEIGRYCR